MGGTAGVGQERVRAERGVAVAGIVYVLSNPAMPGLLKIGMTEREDYGDRLAELYGTGVPFPFHCELTYLVDEPKEIEGDLHAEFADARVNPDREFFEIEVEEIRRILKRMDGVDVTKEAITTVDSRTPETSVHARNVARQRQPKIDFYLLDIESGEILSAIGAQAEIEVVSRSLVALDGAWMSLISATRKVFPEFSGRAIDYWEIGGRSLADIHAFITSIATANASLNLESEDGAVRGRAPNLNFDKMEIPRGAVLTSTDSNEEAVVVSHNRVRFRGIVQALTAATTAARNGKAPAHPTQHWIFRGENVGNIYYVKQRIPWERGED